MRLKFNLVLLQVQECKFSWFFSFVSIEFEEGGGGGQTLFLKRYLTYNKFIWNTFLLQI